MIINPYYEAMLFGRKMHMGLYIKPYHKIDEAVNRYIEPYCFVLQCNCAHIVLVRLGMHSAL